MSDRRVHIEHPKTGVRYAVTPAVFRRKYEPEGFKITQWEDGQPYEEPKRAAAKADEKAD